MSEKQFEVLFYGDVINCVRDENGKEYNLQELIDILMKQQATITELEKEVNLLRPTNLEQYEQIQKLQEENEQLRRLFEEMKQPITINLTEEDEKELRKLLGLIDDE